MRKGFGGGLAAGVVAGVVLGTALTAWAASKTYQYSGTVTEAGDKTLSVDKGGEVWQFALDGDSKGAEAIKAGDKVTVTYRMFATRVEKKK